MEKGLVIVYTGDGKGKTTAALGLTVRAAGYKMKVLMIQFIKGDFYSGEVDGAKYLPDFKLIKGGKGFVKIMNDKKPFEEHKKAAEETYELAKQEIREGKYDIIILDEISLTVKERLLTVEQIEELINVKPEKMTLVLTGRDVPKRIIELADLVTEMKEIKHPFKKNIPAKKGIDF